MALKAHQSMTTINRLKRGLPARGFPFPPNTTTLWVKYDWDGEAIRNEAAMQSFLRDQLVNVPGLRIPKVHRVHVSN